MSEVTVADVMSTDVLTTEPARTLADAAREMGEHNVGAVVVVDPERRRPQRLRARRGGRPRDPRLLGEGRERLKSAGIFLGSFSRGLYVGPRKGQASDIERRRTGRLLRSGRVPRSRSPSPGAGAGAEGAARIEYGSGSLTVR